MDAGLPTPGVRALPRGPTAGSGAGSDPDRGPQGALGGGLQPWLPAWSPPGAGTKALSVRGLQLQPCTQPPWGASLPGIGRPRGISTRVCTVAKGKAVTGSRVPGRGRVASPGRCYGPKSAPGTLSTSPRGGSVADRVPSWGAAAGVTQGASASFLSGYSAWVPSAWVPGPAHSRGPPSTERSNASHRQDRTQGAHSLSRPVPATALRGQSHRPSPDVRHEAGEAAWPWRVRGGARCQN